jgi:mannosyltransferase OCH1-like enzyme
MSVLPKLIHQIWIQGQDNLPKEYKENQNTWIYMNPGWEYRLWDDQQLIDLIEEKYYDLLERYMTYTKPVLKADLGRLVVLHEYGGIYLDMDTNCTKTYGLDQLYKCIDINNNNNVVFLSRALVPFQNKRIRRMMSILPSNYCMIGPKSH